MQNQSRQALLPSLRGFLKPNAPLQFAHAEDLGVEQLPLPKKIRRFTGRASAA